jgi:predicted O-linked N-acetylglucosamine transferase (SPINDLY family)
MLGWLFGKRRAETPQRGAPEALAEAFAHHQAGRLAEAQAGYQAVLQIDARNFDAVNLLGVVALQSMRPAQAAEHFSLAVDIAPQNAAAHNNLGEAYRRLGRYDDAIAALGRAVAQDANYAEAHFNLGGVLRRLHRAEEASAAFARAAALKPAFTEAHLRLGEALNALGRPEAAMAALRAALELEPELAEAHGSLGTALRDAGRLDEALVSCQRAVALKPDSALAHLNVGNVLRDKGFHDEAITAYRTATTLDADFAEAHNNLGNMLRDRQRLDEALASFERALQLDPGLAEAWLNVGSLLCRQRRFADAAEVLVGALVRKPDFVDAHIELGNARMAMGEQAAALACYRAALAHDPESAVARWSLAMSQLPAVAASDAEFSVARDAFATELGELERWCESRSAEHTARAVAVQQPFYLAYQEADHRDLLSRYGRLCGKLAGQWQAAAGLAAASRITRAEIRVGIVSAHIHDHSVWNAIVKGWLTGIDRTRFDVRLFHLGVANDAETALAKTLATHYSYGRTDWREWAPLILGHQPDILIYPEISMDPTTAKLAAMRLAPVQAAAWGHPLTTGLPSIDYFLSADALEPPAAETHYAEKLVRLPGLGVCLEPQKAVPREVDLAALGIRGGVPLLVCAGTPFKYTPRHDAVLVEIARALGECQFVFFTPQPPQIAERLRSRLERAFADAGLDAAAFIAWVPWQDRASFHGLMAQADVYLDTLGFSGFNSALQAIECGLPIVAWEGKFLRGRLASGILRRMGLDELVVGAPPDYVQAVVKLARDAVHWGAVRERMIAARPRLYNDAEPVRALERFLEDAVRK